MSIGGGETITVDSALLNNSSATLSVAGTLALGGTLDLLTVQAGTLSLSGTVQGGMIAAAGGTVAVQNGAVLSGITYLGTLRLAGTYAYVTNGLTVNTAAGGSPGTSDLLSPNAQLAFLDSNETLDNVTLLMGATGFTSYLSENVSDLTLTLGSHAVLTQTIGSVSLVGSNPGDALSNQGQMNLGGGAFYEDYLSFSNAGAIALDNGEDFFVRDRTVNNSGLVSIGRYAVFHTGSAPLANTGTISIAAGGTLDMQGTRILSGLGAIANSGLLQVSSSGILNLGGGTMDLVPGTGVGSVAVLGGGTVRNRTIKSEPGSSFTPQNGSTLDTITYLGTLAEGPSVLLYVQNGLIVKDSAGATTGTIDLTATAAQLRFLDSESLDNVALLMGAASTNYLVEEAACLTLGSHAVLAQTTGNAELYGYGGGAGGVLINQGQMNLAGGAFSNASQSFSNAGTIALSNWETFTALNSGVGSTFDNTGLISIGANSVFDTGTPARFSNSGTFAIAGGGRLMLRDNGIAAGGTLEVNVDGVATPLAALGGVANFGTTQVDYGAIFDLGAGTLDMNPGALGSLLVMSGGVVRNGIILPHAGVLAFQSNATLDNITDLGPVTVGANTYVVVSNGLRAPTIDLTAANAQLYFSDTNATLDHTSLLMGGPSGYSYLIEQAGSLTWAATRY